MNLAIEALLVAVGGAVGAVCRFLIQRLDFFGPNKFMLTMLINLSGCLLIGVMWALMHTCIDRRQVYLLVIVGLLGGYTTYSSFGFETFELMRSGRIAAACLYSLTTLVGGLACCGAGYMITSKIAQG